MTDDDLKPRPRPSVDLFRVGVAVFVLLHILGGPVIYFLSR